MLNHLYLLTGLSKARHSATSRTFFVSARLLWNTLQRGLAGGQRCQREPDSTGSIQTTLKKINNNARWSPVLLHLMHTPELIHVSGCLWDFTNPVEGLRNTSNTPPPPNTPPPGRRAVWSSTHLLSPPLGWFLFGLKYFFPACCRLFFHQFCFWGFVWKLWQERHYGANGMVEANWKRLLFRFSCLTDHLRPDCLYLAH